MGEPAIEVRGLRKSFGEKQAVAGVDLEIAAGSLAGLVGPNGAGKTTSLSMMTGLLRPDAGQVLSNGLDVWADPVAAKAVIGVVPAEARLFERLSGEEFRLAYPDHMVLSPDEKILFMSGAKFHPGFWMGTHVADTTIGRNRDHGHSWDTEPKGFAVAPRAPRWCRSL